MLFLYPADDDDECMVPKGMICAPGVLFEMKLYIYNTSLYGVLDYSLS